MFKVYKDDIDPKYWPEFFNTIDSEYGGDVKKFVDYMFDNSIYTSEEKLKKALENADAEMLKNDPAFKTYSDIRALAMRIQSRQIRRRTQS